MDGVLLIDKPAGLTSHDVVARVRRLFRTKKVGHVGTLDPFATGLLIVCLGKATRVVEYLVGCDKEYVAVMRLGQTTDTQDLTGTILSERPVPEFSSAALEAVTAEFLGTIDQIPPMYSAKKIDGTRLYTLARQGKSVARAARAVTIQVLDVLEVALPDVRLRVVCSSGTYIRTLAHDLGERLKCGAHLTALRRTRIGGFGLDDAVSLDHLTALAESEALSHTLRPIDSALMQFPAMLLNTPFAQKIGHGVRLEFPDNADVPTDIVGCGMAEPPKSGQLCRIYAEDGLFLGVAQWSQRRTDSAEFWVLQPRKILVCPDFAENP